MYAQIVIFFPSASRTWLGVQVLRPQLQSNERGNYSPPIVASSIWNPDASGLSGPPNCSFTRASWYQIPNEIKEMILIGRKMAAKNSHFRCSCCGVAGGGLVGVPAATVFTTFSAASCCSSACSIGSGSWWKA